MCKYPYYKPLFMIPGSDTEVLHDFKLLCNLIMGYVSTPMIKRTDVIWNVQLAKIKKKQKKLKE